MPVNISFKWTSSSQVSVHDSGSKSKKLSEINPGVHTVSACMHPCPQESHRTGPPEEWIHDRRPGHQYWTAEKNLPWWGSVGRIQGGNLRKAFWRKFYNDWHAKDPTIHVCFSLPAGMTMGNFISLLHECQSHQMDCKLLEERAGSLSFVCFLSACLTMFPPTALREHEGRRNGTYRYHERAFLHEESMSWTGMGK